MTRRLAPLAPLALAACFVDVGAGATNPAGDSSSGEPSPVTTGGTTGSPAPAPDPSSEAGTTADDATSSVDPSSSTSTSPSTTAPMTTDPPAPVCGDGVVDSNEQCDDGNLADDDFCLPNCVAASCGDGIANQGESDVDCGGPCQPCGLCALCVDDAGCDEALACIDGRCSAYHVVEFDYYVHCGLDEAAFLGVPLQYAGLWRVEALGGGGRIAEEIAYGWAAFCTGLDLSGLGTPFVWPSVEAAYAELDPKSVVVSHAGGPTACGLPDDVCFDNAGSSQLGFTLVCP